MAGNKITNLRQIITDSAKKEGWACKCIRCREAGRAQSVGSKTKDAKLIQRK